MWKRLVPGNAWASLDPSSGVRGEPRIGGPSPAGFSPPGRRGCTLSRGAPLKTSGKRVRDFVRPGTGRIPRRGVVSLVPRSPW